MMGREGERGQRGAAREKTCEGDGRQALCGQRHTLVHRSTYFLMQEDCDAKGGYDTPQRQETELGLGKPLRQAMHWRSQEKGVS